MVPSASLRRSLPRALVPSPALCRPLLIPRFCLSQRFLLWSLGRPLGFACMRWASFQSFWPLALASQAPPAIILAALRRFRGAALFRGPRPSSSQGVPFWPSGLTRRSSRPAYGGRLTLGVSLRKTRFIKPHVLFTGVYLLKRLFVGFWVSRRASPFGAAPVFSFFASSAPPRWHNVFSQFAPVVNSAFSVLASGSNFAVKPTHLRRAAYFRSLYFRGINAHNYYKCIL